MKAVASLALGFLMLAVVFGPLERLFPARRQRLLRPELAIDVCFFAGQYLAFAALCGEYGVAMERLGEVVADPVIEVRGQFTLDLDEVRARWRAPIRDAMGAH